jgi:hypothetical protein
MTERVRSIVDESGVVYDVEITAWPPKWLVEKVPDYVECVEVRIDDLPLIYVWVLRSPKGLRWYSANVHVKGSKKPGGRAEILGPFRLQESAISAAINWRLRSSPEFADRLTIEQRKKIMKPTPKTARVLAKRRLAKELGGGLRVNAFVQEIVTHRAPIEAFLIRMAEIDEEIAQQTATLFKKHRQLKLDSKPE